MGIQVNFEGKIALITGASGGLGARFAKVLAMAGAQVVLASRRVELLKELRVAVFLMEARPIKKMKYPLSIRQANFRAMKKDRSPEPG